MEQSNFSIFHSKQFINELSSQRGQLNLDQQIPCNHPKDLPTTDSQPDAPRTGIGPTGTLVIPRPILVPPPGFLNHPAGDWAKYSPWSYLAPVCPLVPAVIGSSPWDVADPTVWPASGPCSEALLEASRAAGLMGTVDYSVEESKPLRQRRSRANYAPWQLRRLEQAFKVTQYPDVMTRETLAMELDLIEPRVQVWFQNRRAKQRRSYPRPKTLRFPHPRRKGVSKGLSFAT